MALVPTELLYFTQPIASIVSSSYNMPDHDTRFRFLPNANGEFIAKLWPFLKDYYATIGDVNFTDEAYELLLSRHNVSEADLSSFLNGVSICLSDGSLIQPYVYYVDNHENHKMIGWRDSGEIKFIKFYNTNKKYGFLSNFSKHSFILNGTKWPTVEHYYQSAKFNFLNQSIIQAKTPFEAAQLGRIKGHPDWREDWDDVKYNFMLKALIAKFKQNKYIGKKLSKTYPHRIIEHTKNDSYWGDGGDGTGKNMLGVALMTTRSWIRV